MGVGVCHKLNCVGFSFFPNWKNLSQFLVKMYVGESQIHNKVDIASLFIFFQIKLSCYIALINFVMQPWTRKHNIHTNTHTISSSPPTYNQFIVSCNVFKRVIVLKEIGIFLFSSTTVGGGTIPRYLSIVSAWTTYKFPIVWWNFNQEM